MSLRDYQEIAANSAIKHVRSCRDPFLVVIGTGGGKSHIIAKIAAWVHAFSGGKVLVTAPKSEIIISNYEKFVECGYQANIFSASLNAKQLRHNITFGSPVSVLNSIEKFNGYKLVLMDEPRDVPPTLRKVIEVLAEKNGGTIRVGGFSATPFVRGTGYIYEIGHDGEIMKEAHEPFFKKQVCDFGLGYLIKNGWNLPPVFSAHATNAHYNTTFKSNVKKDEVSEAFEGKTRKTELCMLDMMQKTQDRHSVLIFAQTKQHADECAQHLPPGSYEIITDGTKNRDKIIERFKRFEIKYLINISILGVGVNLPCVDAICIVRYTESLDLLIQIIGRGTRRYVGKDDKTQIKYSDGTVKSDFIVLDYTDNFEQHFPDGDFYNPKVISKKTKESKNRVRAACESCGYVNDFAARDNPSNFGIDANGYFSLLNGQRLSIKTSDDRVVYMPAHFGRRCNNQLPNKKTGLYERCDSKWSFKLCNECGEQNDIAARYCCNKDCKAEIVNPNDKLKEEAAKMTSDFDPITANVVKIISKIKTTTTGRNYIEVLFLTDSMPKWVRCEIYKKDDVQLKAFNLKDEYFILGQIISDLPENCKTVTYRKKPRSTRNFTLISVEL